MTSLTIAISRVKNYAYANYFHSSNNDNYSYDKYDLNSNNDNYSYDKYDLNSNNDNYSYNNHTYNNSNNDHYYQQQYRSLIEKLIFMQNTITKRHFCKNNYGYEEDKKSRCEHLLSLKFFP